MERSVMIHLTWPFLVITNEMISEMRKPFKISDLDKSQASSNPVVRYLGEAIEQPDEHTYGKRVDRMFPFDIS